MNEKEYILEVRAMTWEESCDFEDKREEAVQKYKDSPRKVGQIMVGVIIDMLYPKAKLLLTPAESLEVYHRTMQLSNLVREDEIKNLKPSSAGSTNEPVIAETAE